MHSLGISSIFICGTDTDVGKTVCTGALLRSLYKNKIKAQALKLIQTGIDINNKESYLVSDSYIHEKAVKDIIDKDSLPISNSLFTYKLASSPHLAANECHEHLNVKLVVNSVKKHCENYSKSSEILLIEGSGGLHVPLNEDEDMLDIMVELNTPVILVARNRLGVLNQVFLSLDLLKMKSLDVLAVILITQKNDNYELNKILNDNINIISKRLTKYNSKASLINVPFVDNFSYQSWDILADKFVQFTLNLKEKLNKYEEEQDIIEMDAKTIWHPYSSISKPIVVHEAIKSYKNRIVLKNGKELIDGMSSWWAAIFGYNNPVLLDSIHQQAEKMPHVMFGGLTHNQAVKLADNLLRLVPNGLSRVFFSDSGSVAVEVAMKMALQYQIGKGEKKKSVFLAPRGGYHGDTLGAMSICDPVTGMHSLFSHNLTKQIFVERPRCRFDQEFDESSLDDIKRAFLQHSNKIAAVILEPIVQGAGGMWFYHPKYLSEIRKICDEYGVLLIADEIATGFGRVKKIFACEYANISPDILCCGKAVTGGIMSLAATICSDKVAQGICNYNNVFMHGPTFMANALACSVSNAMLNIFNQNLWFNQVSQLEETMNKYLENCKNFEVVNDVRVLGGIGVVELKTHVNMLLLQEFFVSHGVWIRPFNNLIYLMPPYISPEEDIIKLCNVIELALKNGKYR